MISVRTAMTYSIPWLALLVPTLIDFFSRGPDQDMAVGVLVALAAFLILWVWFYLRYLRIAWGRWDEQVGLLVYTAMMVLATPLAFLTSSIWFGYIYFYPALVAGTILRLRLLVPALLFAGLLAALAMLKLENGPAFATAIALQIILFPGLGARLMSSLFETNFALGRARQEIARLAVDEERLRFARDLHDLLGHSLSLIAIKSELSGRLLPSDTAGAAREITDIERVARDSLRDVREAVAGFRQPRLAAELAGARSALEAAGIAVRVEETGGTLPEPVDSVLAWAVREGVTNVIRHSDATRCEIRVSRGEHDAQLEVTDDGRGTDPVASGHGLRGLAERAFARGGVAESGPLPGKGFRLRISVPLAAG